VPSEGGTTNGTSGHEWGGGVDESRRATAARQFRKVKVPDSEISIFTPGDFSRIIHAAPSRLVPMLAISAFAGIRSAEIARLDWSAVDLDRRIIEWTPSCSHHPQENRPRTLTSLVVWRFLPRFCCRLVSFVN
jgi:integrase